MDRGFSGVKLASEVAGVVLIAVAFLLAISLYTHDPQDPSFNSYLSKSSVVQNSAGIVGACVSDLLIQWVGAIGWLVPIIVACLGGFCIYRPETGRVLSFLTGIIPLTITSAALASVIFKNDPIYSKVMAGGVIGSIIVEEFMVRWFSVYGSFVILISIAVCALILITGATVSGAVLQIWKLVLLTRKKTELLLNFVLNSIEKIRKIKFPVLLKTKLVQSKQENEKWVEENRLAHSGFLVEDKDDLEVLGKAAQRKAPTISDADLQNPSHVPQLKIHGYSKEKEEENDNFQQEIIRFKESENYTYPDINLLDSSSDPISKQTKEDLIKCSKILERKLKDFGVEGKVTQVLPGPVITVYEFEPGPGIKVSKIVNLSDDIAMVLRSTSVRILAPVPGKSVVGVEVPNPSREMVYLKELLSSNEFQQSASKLTMALGKDISGNPAMFDMAKVPHLLIAGSTGAGKSVGINAMICSILYKATPAEVKFIMIDPKMLELSIYEGIPHLISPVVTNPKKAAKALRWAVEEMERRYTKLSEVGVRNISGYNMLVQEKIDELKASSIDPHEENANDDFELPEKLPYIVLVIDELADLMLVAANEVEDSLTRLAQTARAAGIHLIVATQRPSVDVLTGLIKANFPARISYQVRSRIDSRTILDSMGADKLLGNGDMLFLPPGASTMHRVHGPFVSDREIHRIVDFLKQQQQPIYDDHILEMSNEEPENFDDIQDVADDYYDKAVEFVVKSRQASISSIQRRFRIGYNRAARIVEMMEKQGIVGPPDGIKPREILIRALDDVESIN
ncbi:MAG TPA: DNA translocase FtsK 4TM domain-containing protein [Nitrospinota bacterium]|nr:DNA translocase FtsK 4TM domain-containing protein [Nitrospinota bacterium]|tara:strand:+ start:34606 stop:36993 length:2388 start_codon:yes stop_codon:yes gene_type:complete